MIKTDLLVRHPYRIWTHKEIPNRKAYQAFSWKENIIIVDEFSNGQKQIIQEVSYTDFKNWNEFKLI